VIRSTNKAREKNGITESGREENLCLDSQNGVERPRRTINKSQREATINPVNFHGWTAERRRGRETADWQCSINE